MTRAEIQFVRSLADKRGRTESGLFVAEGEKLVRELLASDFRVAKVYFTEGNFDREGAEKVSAKDMERISGLKTPSGCLALAGIPHTEFDPGALRGKLTLALDDVQNPGNLGTIIRIADWFGITDILCSENSADRFNPKVVQATMGSITRVRVHYGRLAEMIARAAAEGVPVLGTFLEGENIYPADLPTEGIVVLGSEGSGISEEVARLVTHKIFIPPYPASGSKAESLNVASAAAIVCSEFRRRS